MMAKGELSRREPGRVYGCDFTNHSLTTTVHGPVNGWHIMEVRRVYHRDLYPDHVRTEHLFHVGMRMRSGGLVRMIAFDSYDAAHQWAVMTGRTGWRGGRDQPIDPDGKKSRRR